MRVENLLKIIGADFYAGIPDSQLKELCNFLMNKYGIDARHHVIAANEGNCVAIAAGYHLATGRVPVVYLQNSGQGNVINPVVSLLNDKVYAIPVVFIIGWRGEPGVYDEPQHVFQGEITLRLLEDMGIDAYAIGKETSDEELSTVMEIYKGNLVKGKSVAFVIKKGAISYDKKIDYVNTNAMIREEVIKHIVNASGENPVVCTTGKASRELFETRVTNCQSHKYDFLTVGSMGHSSSIAMGIAVNKPNVKVWCIDGDGAVLMHMGALAVLGTNAPSNMIHIIINNCSHETVGGMPTVASNIDLVSIAKACGYPNAVCVNTYEDLDRELKLAKSRNELSLIEVKCAIGSRADLGRPTTTTIDNKCCFMEYLKNFEQC